MVARKILQLRTTRETELLPVPRRSIEASRRVGVDEAESAIFVPFLLTFSTQFYQTKLNLSHFFILYPSYRAVKAFRQVLWVEPGFPRACEVHLRLGLMLKVQSDFDGALKHLTLALIDASTPASFSKLESKSDNINELYQRSNPLITTIRYNFRLFDWIWNSWRKLHASLACSTPDYPNCCGGGMGVQNVGDYESSKLQK